MSEKEMVEDGIRYRECPACGNWVPVCERCNHRLPHGNVGGTWLPCRCSPEARGEPYMGLPWLDAIRREIGEAG